MGVIQKLNERGFSIVETSVVFLVIIMLATAAGIVADRQNSNNSQQLKPNVIQLGTQPSPHASSSPTTTTLELSALGIDITVPNAISDLTYAAPASNGGYGVSTKALTTQDPSCVVTGNAPPLGYFFKGTGQYSDVNDGRRLARQFSSFYIAWAGPKVPCSSSSTVMALANQQLQELTDSFDSIEEIPASTTN